MPDPLAEIRRLMLLNVNDPHQATTRWPPGAVTFKPYVYRGQGYDIYEDTEGSDDDSA